MAKKQERTYATTFSEEAITMDKYNELIKDIARLIADTNRENFLLKCELDAVKAELASRDAVVAAAEAEIERKDQKIAAAEEQLETVVAKQAVEMMKGGEGIA